MNKRIILTLLFLVVACSTAVNAPTVEVKPPVTSVSADTQDAPPAQATPVDMPDEPEIVFGPSDGVIGDDGLPVPAPEMGLWRVYDEKAQVVCWVYGAKTTTNHAYSGISCLPVSETSIGK